MRTRLQQEPGSKSSNTDMSLLSKLFTLAILAYQYLISPLCMPSCGFQPTCSEYAKEAIRKHGAIKGIWLSTKRIARCHPWSKRGYDPVS